MKSLTNFHLYPSYFTNESRILREAEAMIESNLVNNIKLIGIWRAGLAEKEILMDGLELSRMKTFVSKSAVLKWLNIFSFTLYYFRTLQLARKVRPDIVNAHSLTVLPLGVLLKKTIHCKLIYDPHELETETNDSRGIRKTIARWIEKKMIPYADFTIVVSNSIESWYKEKYNLTKIKTIKNIPKLNVRNYVESPLRKRLGLTENDILFVYSGVLGYGRGIETLLRIFSNNPDKHIVFLGFGTLEKDIRKSIIQSKNIHHIEPVPPDQVSLFVSGADVGISFIENTCLSYYYSLPNKVFEYLSAGIPFISSDFPDVRNEFESSDLAWFAPTDKKLQDIIATLDKSEIKRKKVNVLRHQKKWSWSNEAVKLKYVFSQLLL